MRNNYLVLDLETGGLDKTKDAILQFGFVVLDFELKELDKGETLVKPEKRNVTTKALEINGLNLETCESKGVTREQLYKGIKMICEKFDMGAENNLIRDFERENNTLIDAEKQVKNEEREKELEFER